MIEIKDYSEEFQEWLKKTRKVSSQTECCYLNDIKNYCEYTSNCGISLESGTDLYLTHLDQQGISKSYKARCITSLRAFFEFLVESGYSLENPFSTVKLPKIEKKPPQTLTVQQMQMFLSAPDISAFDGMRDKILLELMYQTGLKLTDILALNVENVNLQMNVITVKKNSRERIFPIFSPLNVFIADYISPTRLEILKGKASRALLINLKGGRLTRQSAWLIVDKYAKKCGIEQKVTPQTIRMSLASHIIDEGATISEVKDAMNLSESGASTLYSTISKIKYGQAIYKNGLFDDNFKN